MSVGMPQWILLQEFGELLRDAFGEIPYHVGSSVRNKQWRDVDVRLILDDDAYRAQGFGDPTKHETNAKWRAVCRAFCALGRDLTGLPIDFQIQGRTYANATFSKKDEHIRSALFRTIERCPTSIAAPREGAAHGGHDVELEAQEEDPRLPEA